MEDITSLAPIFKEFGAGNVYIILLILVTAYHFIEDIVRRWKGWSPEQNAEKLKALERELSNLKKEVERQNRAIESAKTCPGAALCPVLLILNKGGDYADG